MRLVNIEGYSFKDISQISKVLNQCAHGVAFEIKRERCRLGVESLSKEELQAVVDRLKSKCQSIEEVRQRAKKIFNDK